MFFPSRILDREQRGNGDGTRFPLCVWLRKALEAERRDPAEADHLVRTRSGSRQAQAIDELIVYEEARNRYTKLVESGRKVLEKDLATLCIEAAFVHESAGDRPGQVALYERAIDISERLANQESGKELAGDLAWAQLAWSNVARKTGRRDEAVGVARLAIRTLESEIQRTGRADLQNVLNWARQNLADLL